MLTTLKVLSTTVFMCVLFLGLTTPAEAFSFGGKVISVVPCSGGMLHVTIIPAGIQPITYIWTPLTITKLVGPPVAPGMQVLGLYDVPFVCFLKISRFFGNTFIPLFGFRMTTVGTSPPTTPSSPVTPGGQIPLVGV